jgi:response regulator RpfG family c-di-GMP phosphodiesterase
VARLAADTASRLLAGRAALIELDGSGANPARASSGPGLSRDRHRQAIATTDGTIGSLEVDCCTREGRELRQSDLELLESIAAATAIAARNQIHRRERDDAQHATIFALAGLAEYRDDETGRHLERVAEYCRLIAIGLRIDGHFLDQIDESFLDDLVLSAPLHDIGKVGIPDSILFKPGKLTEAEWEVMRKHTTIGAETLQSALDSSGERGFLRMGHDIAWCHHERWDGSGYPRGLSGLAIPLSARIMSVADCYDALTTWRPYKEAWPHADAVAYIRDHAGTQFDPLVVAAFLSREAEANRVRRCLSDERAAVSAV